MAFRLIPKDEKFVELFEAQATFAVDAAKAFKELCRDFRPDSPLFDRVRELEHEADITTHELIDKLNRTFVTPFDREDIHGLASEMDDVVDLINLAASRMRLYRVDRSSDELYAGVDVLLEATQYVRKAVVALHKPEESGRRLLEYCIEVNRLEEAGDLALAAAIGGLFKGEADALQVMKWKEIYEIVEQAIDKCEDVANTIESIQVKQG